MQNKAEKLNETLEHLRALVSCNTCNPPRDMTGDTGIFAYFRENLPGFEIEVTDHGEGCVSLLATRGTPSVLINCHVDTVPVAETWEQDPHVLRVEKGRATGLGACDIKGAAAALLCAAAHTKGDIALLFTSDEEAGQGKCVREFVKRELPYDLVVVSEPTRCEAVLEHRGIVTGTATFHGVAGHSSLPRALEDSAVHEAVRWSSRAIEWAARRRDEDEYQGLPGTALNLGRFEGGTKPNMVAAEATIRFGMRPLPSHDSEALLGELKSLATDPWRVSWKPGFFGPTLPARGKDGAPGAARVETARQKALALGLSPGNAVNFWTEAALFSQAGYDAVVFGPGDIAQAHTGGEFVELLQLEAAYKVYEMIMKEA